MGVTSSATKIDIDGQSYYWSQVYDLSGVSPATSVSDLDFNNSDTKSGQYDGDYTGIAAFFAGTANAADLSYNAVVHNATEFGEWVGSIIKSEGGDAAAHGTITLPMGEQVVFALAYDAKFSNTLGGTEIDLDNDIATKIVDGSVWYTENTGDKRATFSSNISTSYSSANDPKIREPWRLTSEKTTTAPIFMLGSSDTDTFYHLGDGTKIIVGAAKDTLSITSNDDVIFDENTIILPTGFLDNPTSFITGAAGKSELSVVNGANQTITGTIAGEMLISAGSGDILNAGVTMNTLIDLTGTTGTYDLNPSPDPGIFIENPNYPTTFILYPAGSLLPFSGDENYNGGVTEIAFALTSGIISANNTFNAFGGDNILIGDGGDNTFSVETDYEVQNVIYGGGGHSTYEVQAGGTIDILYTNITPTAAEIDNWAKGIFQADVNSSVSVTHIIDPTSSDTLSNCFGPASGDANGKSPRVSGTYIATQNAGNPSSSPAGQDEGYNLFTLQNGYEAINMGSGTVGIGAVGNWSGSAYNYQLYGEPGFYIDNFVNGDLGITFSGDSYKFPLLYDTTNTISDGTPPANAYGDIAGDVYSFHGKQHIFLDTSSSQDVNAEQANSGRMALYPARRKAIENTVFIWRSDHVSSPWLGDVSMSFVYPRASKSTLLMQNDIYRHQIFAAPTTPQELVWGNSRENRFFENAYHDTWPKSQAHLDVGNFAASLHASFI